MACVIGALILANAVIGHGPEDEAKSPVLRWSALALGVTVLPLAIIAAVAMGLRIGQYGMTPDRLWGLTVVVFAVAYGLVYLARCGARAARLGAADPPRQYPAGDRDDGGGAGAGDADPRVQRDLRQRSGRAVEIGQGERRTSSTGRRWRSISASRESARSADLQRSANAAIAKRAVEVAKAR